MKSFRTMSMLTFFTAALTVTTTVPALATAHGGRTVPSGQQTQQVLPAPGHDGTGWGASLRHTSTNPHATLVLISPKGGYRTLGPITDNQRIRHINKDAGRVVTDDFWRDPDGNETYTHLHVQLWTTHTAKMRQLTLPYPQNVAYSDAGIFTVTTRAPGQPCALTMYDYNGKVRHRITGIKCREAEATPTVSADGRQVSLVADDAVYVWGTDTGKLVKRFRAPYPQKPDSYCVFEGSLDREHSLMSCSTVGVGNGNFSYSVRLDTGSHQTVPYSAMDTTVKVPSGYVTHDISPRDGGSNPWTLHHGTSAKKLSLAQSTQLAGVDKANLFVQDTPGSGPTQRVMKYNVDTGATTYLAGTSTTGNGFFDDTLVVNRWQQP